MVFKVCHALEYANTEGLLHRDIKPANVLLAKDGTPKVSDFGAVYMTGTDETQVIGVGTLPFMPPEHFEGSEPHVQHDIYATGVMAYNLLTGHYPHRGETQSAMIYEKLHGEPVPLERRRQNIPEGLRAAIDTSMHRDRSKRFHTWKEFRAALSAAFPQIREDKAVHNERARFEAMRLLPFFARFSDTEMWDAMANVSNRLVAGSSLVPFLTVGATDARFFRRAGSVAYGFGLFSRRVSFDDYASMFHGYDERVAIESLELSTHLWHALAHEMLG